LDVFIIKQGGVNRAVLSGFVLHQFGTPAGNEWGVCWSTAAFGAALTHCGARQRGAGVVAIGRALRWQVRLTCDFLK